MSVKVRYQWTGDLREALAKSVRKREKLWKKFPVVSHDVELRAKLWAEVAEELTMQFGVLIDTDDMKKTWKNLKDNYWRISRMYENDPLKPRRWRFYHCMRFMERANIDDSLGPDGHLQNQPSSSNSPQARRRFENARLLVDGVAELRNDEFDTHLSGSDGGSGQEGSESGKERISNVQQMRDLIQISIPELDRFIKTKQKPSTGAEIYCIPVEDVEDVLVQELSKVWSQGNANQDEMEDQFDNQIDAMPSDSNMATSLPERMQLWRYDKKMRSATEKEARLLELIQIAGGNIEINDETRNTIHICASTLRGVYHQAAFALFMKQNMPSGQLQTLVDAYDDFVYNNNKPTNKVISKVVKGCEPNKQKAFAALFAILEKHADTLNLRCPDDRWAQIDNEARKNIDNLFGRVRGKKAIARFNSELRARTNGTSSIRKRRKHVLTELGAEEQRRFQRMRTVIAKKIAEYTSALESTKALLEMVEPEDNETREELENTLRNVEEMYEKTKKDQQRLDVQYQEFQNRSFGPRRKRRPPVETDSCARDKVQVSKDDISKESDLVELFSNAVKVETNI